MGCQMSQNYIISLISLFFLFCVGCYIITPSDVLYLTSNMISDVQYTMSDIQYTISNIGYHIRRLIYILYVTSQTGGATPPQFRPWDCQGYHPCCLSWERRIILTRTALHSVHVINDLIACKHEMKNEAKSINKGVPDNCSFRNGVQILLNIYDDLLHNY